MGGCAVGDAENELRALGCSDGYCEIAGKATGMHTNGGCHCLWRLGEHPEQVAKMAKALRILHKERDQLRAVAAAMAAALRLVHGHLGVGEHKLSDLYDWERAVVAALAAYDTTRPADTK